MSARPTIETPSRMELLLRVSTIQFANDRISALLIALESKSKLISLVFPGSSAAPEHANTCDVASVRAINRAMRFNLVPFNNVARDAVCVVERKVRIPLGPIPQRIRNAIFIVLSRHSVHEVRYLMNYR